MNIVASIQARMGSTRLPGKVLKEVCEKPMLLWQIERIRRSRLVDDVVVATTTSGLDDEIYDFCTEHGISCYRGSENDVLGRVASLIKDLKVDIHVECYGDSPLTDPQIVDEFVGFLLKNFDDLDYVSSSIKTSYPPGFEVTVYPGKSLLDVDRTVALDDPLREHVGYNVTRFPNKYKIYSIEAPFYFHEPDIYLEVDTQEDLNVMRGLFEHFKNKGRDHFCLGEVLDVVRTFPDLFRLNSHVERRWKKYREEDA